MNIGLYIKNPIWGISNIKNKFFDSARGRLQSIKYKSGKSLHVENGVRLDCPDIVFGKNDTLSINVRIFGKGKVEIGDNVVIGEGSVICSDEYVKIGNDSMIAAHCYITDCNHGMARNGVKMREQKLRVKKCVIGDNVWVAANCLILPGSVINNGVVVGANSVVDGLIEENTIVFGNRELGKRLRR